MTKEERRENPCYACGKPEYAHVGGRFCGAVDPKPKPRCPELDSDWLELISRHYMSTEDMRERMGRIAEKLRKLEALEELTRVEMERLEKERGVG